MITQAKEIGGKAAERISRLETINQASWTGVPFWAVVAALLVCVFYFKENRWGAGEPFAWLDGTSAWPSIGIMLFSAFLSVHFIIKGHLNLKLNAARLKEEFGLRDVPENELSFFGWGFPWLRSDNDNGRERIDIESLWGRYLTRGSFLVRVARAGPMTFFYIGALWFGHPVLGGFPTAPIRGEFNFRLLIFFTITVFLLLTFFVIDAIILHEGFLRQLSSYESYWPDTTFEKGNYPTTPRPENESDLSDYWDILLISKRTEAVGNLIYYPFVILSLLIVARFKYFDNWIWSPVLIAAFSLHFLLALFAAWRLPRIAKDYRDKVLARLRVRRRQALTQAQRMPEVIDTMIEEVQSTHRGAFSYLWEQPALRALFLPSGGLGIAALLQYLPH
jgi:hypothetical protein